MIVLDVDGVLADFVTAALHAHSRMESHDEIKSWDFYKEWGLTPEEFWAKCRGRDFWMSIQPYPEAIDLLSDLQALGEVVICTTPSDDNECPGAKFEWLRHHFGLKPDQVCITGNKAILAHRGNLLIDDNPFNVAEFVAAGGFGYGFPRPWNNFAIRNTIGAADAFMEFSPYA